VIPALVVYALAAVPAFMLVEPMFYTWRALLVAALWPLWPIAFGAAELGIFIDNWKYDREQKRNRGDK